MLFFCLVLHLFFVAARASVVFEDCGSAYDLHAVNIEGCGTRLPCYVTLGDNITVNYEFLAVFESSKLDQDVTININYIHAKTPVTPEPCEMGVCPVQTQAITSFTSIMSVPTNMALNQRGFLQWRVYNENGMQVLCYSVMVQTQNYFQKILRQTIGKLSSYEPTNTKLHGANNENSITKHFDFQRLLRTYYRNVASQN